MRRYEDEGVVVVTPEMAQDWLTRYSYDSQRTPKMRLIRKYARLMQNDKFRRSTITFHSVHGQRVLTNGLQRMNAVLVGGVPIEVRKEVIHCDTWDEVREDYAVYDGANSGRTRADVRKARGVAGQFRFRVSDLRAVESAIGVLITGFQSEQTTWHELASDANCLVDGSLEWHDEATRFFEAIDRPHHGMPASILRHRALVAVGLVLMRYQTEQGFKFLETVAQHRADAGDAPHELAIVLAGRRFWGCKTILDFSRTVARSWNAYLDGTKPNMRPTQREKDNPIQLNGTPYDGTRIVTYCPKGWEALKPVEAVEGERRTA